MNVHKNFRAKILRVYLPILTVALMLYFLIVDGVVWGVDTQGYLNMDISREAGYPLFLHLLILLFGESRFAQVAVILQFILLGTSILLLTNGVKKLWNLSDWSVFVVWGIQIFFLILLKFGSGLGVIYTNTLLTEGITYPVYFLFFKTVLQLNREYSRKELFELLLYCSILTFIRTHLAVTYIAVLFFWLIQVMVKRFPIKKWAGMVGGCLLSLVIVMGGQKIYTYVLYGVPAGTVGSNSFFMVSGLYHAQEDDEKLFELEEEKTVFRELYQLSLQREANYQFAESNGFLPLTEHYAQNFDIVKFRVVSPYLYEYLTSTQDMKGVQAQIAMDQWNKRIGFPLFLKHLNGKTAQFFQECLRGYMRTVAKGEGKFLFLVLVIYLIYFCFLIYSFRFKDEGVKAAGWGALFVLIVSTGNIVLTAFMIFCEPRYVLYNMVPFYITGYLLVLGVYRKRKEEKTR